MEIKFINKFDPNEERMFCEIQGLKIDGKTVVVKEIRPVDFANSWGRIQELASREDLNTTEQLKLFLDFGNNMIPDMVNLETARLMGCGFSVHRKIFEAFQEVNEDFLWMLGSLGVTSFLSMVWTKATTEIKQKILDVVKDYFAAMQVETEANEAEAENLERQTGSKKPFEIAVNLPEQSQVSQQ